MVNGVIVPAQDDKQYIEKAQLFDIAGGGSKTLTLEARAFYFVMTSSNVSGACTLVRCRNADIQTQPLITESGIALTSSGLKLTITNPTAYSLAYQIVKISQ